MDAMDLLAPVSGIISGVSTAITNKQNRRFQREMWDKTNAYNTPLAQRQRMEQAGLNPNLMYGTGTIANTAQNQNLPDATPPDFTSALAGTLGAYQDIRNKRVDMQMTTQNLANAKAMEDKIKAEAFKANSEALAASANLPEDMKKSLLANQATMAGIENVKATTEATRSNTALDPYRENQMVQSAHKTLMEAYQMPKELALKTASTVAQIKNTNAQTQQTLKNIGYIDANQQLNITKIIQDIQSIRLKNKGQSTENIIKQTQQHWQKLGLTMDVISKLTPLLFLL